MPVCPRTPGVMTDTCRNKSSPAAFVSSFGICRVAKIPRATAGPNASGVISVFPSPAANISPSLSGSRYSSSSLIISLKFSGSSNEISGNSSVIYLPRGLPRSLSSSEVFISSREAFTLPLLFSFFICPIKLFSQFSAISIARSVLTAVFVSSRSFYFYFVLISRKYRFFLAKNSGLWYN